MTSMSLGPLAFPHGEMSKLVTQTFIGINYRNISDSKPATSPGSPVGSFEVDILLKSPSCSIEDLRRTAKLEMVVFNQRRQAYIKARHKK